MCNVFYKNRRTVHVYSPPPSASIYSFLSLCLSSLLLSSIPASVSLYSCLCFHLSSLLLPSTFTPCFPLSLPQISFIPTSAFIYPRPEPDLLLNTLDLPVAVLLPTTFPCRDTPFLALNCVSLAVFLSSGPVSCSDTPFTAQKSVSRTK